MNSEGENGSLLHQSIQEELPSLSTGGTQTDTNINRATFETQTDNKLNTISTQTDYSNMTSGVTQTSNPMKTVETQTSKFTTDAPVQVASQIKNPFKCLT